MFQDFEVKPLFEGQIHERYQFTLIIEGHSYQGIFHDEEIHWFHPHPKNTLQENKLKDLETKVYALMADNVHYIEVKPLFEGQVHERYQFALNVDGDNYHGIYHDKAIQWFHPQPKNKLKENDFENLEANVHELMKNQLKH